MSIVLVEIFHDMNWLNLGNGFVVLVIWMLIRLDGLFRTCTVYPNANGLETGDGFVNLHVQFYLEKEENVKIKEEDNFHSCSNWASFGKKEIFP